MSGRRLTWLLDGGAGDTILDAPAAQRLDSRPELAAQIRSRQAPYAAHQPFREADSPEK